MRSLKHIRTARDVDIGRFDRILLAVRYAVFGSEVKYDVDVGTR